MTDQNNLRNRPVKELIALDWTPEDRDLFWSKVDKTGECWIWTRTKTRAGYGCLTSRQVKLLAHRVSAVLAGKSLAGGLVVDHLCVNPSCVNPDHLDPVTNKENLMRGRGITAARSRQTHCIKGHPLSGDNLYMHKGGRYCRKCRDTAVKEYHKRIGRVTQNAMASTRRTVSDAGEGPPPPRVCASRKRNSLASSGSG